MIRMGTVINFCSLDDRFIGPCIRAVAPVSAQVVVPWADHLFDNTLEDSDRVRRAEEENPEAQFVPFEYHHSITAMLRPRFWHNYARWVGLSRLAQDCDWVLFLDADEIVETDRFREFLETGAFESCDHLYFANYWYFREPRFRARRIEDSPALIRRSVITVNRIFHERERATFRRLPNGRRQVAGLDGRPMFHHYSWVMDKAKMLRKVRTWGHSLDTDRDWERLVEEEFSRPFSGRDFVHGYDFDVVDPLIPLAEEETPAPSSPPSGPEILVPDRHRIAAVDLAPLARYVADPEDLAYFLDTDFREHYRLLACLSKQFSGQTLFDIGTYKGYSALALGFHEANRVVSYDIVEKKKLHDRRELSRIEFVLGDVLEDRRLLAAPLILVDISHDGASEQRIYDFLDRNGYQGIVLFDDIHLNAAMERFWNGIARPKRDITELGHVTGTGMVFFSSAAQRAAASVAAVPRQEKVPQAPARPADGPRLGFHSNQLGLRGSDVALFDYAWFSRALLGASPVIIADRRGDLRGLDRFRNEFPVELYDDFSQVQTVVERYGLEAVYFLKSGADDGQSVRGARNLVHAAFQVCQPHGDVYAYVSAWLAGRMDGGRHPWVPHMVRLPDIDGHFRGRLGIPEEAVVFGRHGGRDQFNIPFVHEVVRRVAAAVPGIYFLFLNTETFCEPRKNIIHLNPTWDPAVRTRFINTCDAMLHARVQGESFGLAVAEFLLRDKPVIAWGDGIDQNHLAMLGDRGLYYRNPVELFDHLTGFRRSAPAGWYRERVAEFSPERVMAAFRSVFLDGVI